MAKFCADCKWSEASETDSERDLWCNYPEFIGKDNLIIFCISMRSSEKFCGYFGKFWEHKHD